MIKHRLGQSKPRQEDNAPVLPEPLPEEEEESEEEIPLQRTVMEPKPHKVTPPPLAPVKPSPVRASPAKPTKSERLPPKREPEPVSDADEEVLEFGRAPKRIKRTSPTPEIASVLELPGQSTSYAQPLPAPPAPSNAEESDAEDYWDEIPPQAPLAAAVDEGEGEGEGEEIDVDEFADLMNQHLVEEEEDDFLAAAVSSEPESRPTGPIMSLRQMVGGDVSEDDFSSSEDSEDD